MLVCAGAEQMKKCMELEERLKTMDREISVNPQYVQKVTLQVSLQMSLREIVMLESCF